MRRPHVYERSAPRPPRNPYHEPLGDPVLTARDIAYVLTGLQAKAEGAGLMALAARLKLAFDEAETEPATRIFEAPEDSTAAHEIGAMIPDVESRYVMTAEIDAEP